MPPMATTDALVVHGGGAAFGVPDFSPPCLKLKTYLRMANQPYVSRLGDPRQGPTKKVPYLTHGATTLGDSGLIVEYLKRTFGDPLDARLTPEEQALGHVVRRTCEESLYWPLVHARWTDESVWPQTAALFKSRLPPWIGGLILRQIRKDVHRNLWGQGTSRHTPENIVRHAQADVDALARLLGDKAYLFGDSPTSFDAVLYGTMANLLAFPGEGPLAVHVRTHANLVAFVDRIKAAYWGTPETTEAPAA